MTIPHMGYQLAGAAIVAKATANELVQGAWHKRNGSDLACLLGAIHADVRSSSDACAATGMPAWLAELMIPLFDGLPSDRIADFGLRFGVSMQGWSLITPEGWSRIETNFQIYCVRQTLEAARPKGDIPSYWPAVEAACLQTLDALASGEKEALIAARAAVGATAGVAWATAEAVAWADQFDALLQFIAEETGRLA